MQSITALAHLRAAVLYVLDISEQCGHSLAQQAALFHSIKPLFANKPLLVVANKVDATQLESLAPADKAVIDEMVSEAARMSGVLPAHLSRRAGPAAWTWAIVCRSHTGSGQKRHWPVERWEDVARQLQSSRYTKRRHREAYCDRGAQQPRPCREGHPVERAATAMQAYHLRMLSC